MTEVRKVVRRKGKGPASAVNAVVVATAGGSGEHAAVSSRQHVEIVQRGGETVVRESTDDTQPKRKPNGDGRPLRRTPGG